MDPAIHQSLAFLCLLLVGIALKLKIKDASELKGIKTLILCVALPATIFMALLKIRLTTALIVLPVLGLICNLALYFVSLYLILPVLVRDESNEKKRTYLLLLSSLAPGLSCFPFIVEYLGDSTLAHAALVDVGNKVFVLIILYLIAMRWYYNGLFTGSSQVNLGTKIKDLCGSLIREPVNAVIIIALFLLLFGYTLTSLPLFMQNLVSKANALTTGMVLIFIGAAFNINRAEAQSIFSILLLRSGAAFIISALAVAISGNLLTSNMALLIVIFPQSSCSFWPLAHMSAIEELEAGAGTKKSTFQVQTGLNILACSLPFSSLLILGICTAGQNFSQPDVCLPVGLCLILFGLALKFLPAKAGKFVLEFKLELQKMRAERDQPA